ncbi:MAG: hypothetical protein ACP6IP_03655 [Candidatus Njordarchaeia archaeon]
MLPARFLDLVKQLKESHLPKVSNAAISKAEGRIGTIPEEELVEAKCECWVR